MNLEAERKGRLLSTFLLIMLAVFGSSNAISLATLPGHVPPWHGYIFLVSATVLNRIGQYGRPVFHVQDNGMGVDPAHREKMLGPFGKLDDQGDGTGVGLAIVKRIVEVHGGRLWVESEGRRKGTTVCFTLPTSRGLIFAPPATFASLRDGQSG